MSDVRRTLLVASLALAGCLATPDPAGPKGTNGTPVKNNTNGETDMGTPPTDTGDDVAEPTDMSEPPDTDAVCPACTLGDRQCGMNASGEHVVQECRPREHGTNCTEWTTDDTCEGAQTCSGAGPTAACGCSDACDPTAAPTCGAAGVQVCITVDGCPALVDVGRDESCTSTCAPESDDAWCGECEGNGRDCVQVCDNATGYICGQMEGM